MDDDGSTLRGKGRGPGDGTAPELERIGKFRILRRVGEGGMGTVFEAEQDAPIRRRVALKLIRSEIDSRSVVVRFEAERQALAMMDHPYIAKVFDAGETAEGRPYFVMELVEGEPITRYCDRHRLGLPERLELFCRVCDAVQHAHQKGIVHRDIKPSNILVSTQDGAAAPRVIDFGIAKATEPSRTPDAFRTQVGELIGTPAYMSPEQAAMTGEAVDTRTDVYALGALLYELLAGTPPFDPALLSKGGFDGLRRMIRETEPPRPSARIASCGPEQEPAASLRRTSVAAWARSVRGDLDWITMRALEKLPSRRYGSPSDLAADVKRHLRHEPVVAGPPSKGYVLAKFVRRNRVTVLATALIVSGLAAGLVAATVGMVRARRAEEDAKRSESSAREVSDFLVGVFDVVDPSGERGSTVTARELLDEASDRIDRGLTSDPLLRARLEHTMGRVYYSLGLYDRSGELLERALDERRRLLGENHREVAESLRMLGVLRQETGAGSESIDLLRRSLAVDVETLGDDDPETAWSRYWLASSLVRFSEELDEAEEHVRRAQAVFEREYGADSQPVAWCLNDLGSVARTRGLESDALGYFTRALAIKERVLRPDHPDLARAYQNLSQSYSMLGRHAEAREFFERGIRIQEATLGPTHPDVGFAYSMFALLCARAGDAPAAREADRKAMEVLRASWGPDHPILLYQHACLLALVGDTDEAIAWVARALEKGVTPLQARTDADLASLRGDPRFDAMTVGP